MKRERKLINIEITLRFALSKFPSAVMKKKSKDALSKEKTK
jgi:hypothetical protein